MKYITLIFLYLVLNLYATDSLAIVNKFDNIEQLSCYDLMSRLIKTSPLGELFKDKSMELDFKFERYDNDYLILVLVTIDNPRQNSVYANFALNLINFTLYSMDLTPRVGIKIYKQYVPFIKEKCTPEENIYIHTGRLESYD